MKMKEGSVETNCQKCKSVMSQLWSCEFSTYNKIIRKEDYTILYKKSVQTKLGMHRVLNLHTILLVFWTVQLKLLDLPF